MRLLLTILSAVMIMGCRSHYHEDLTIAVSANMQFAMHEIVESFEKSTDLKCKMVVSSSGKLTAQIVAGAPFDVLVSADVKYPMELFELGIAIDSPVVYALGKLVLWSTKKDIEPSLEYLGSQNVKHIAIANPATAPYGAAAIEVLKKYGMLESIQHKLVYGESISQTNQFVISGSAEAGFTAMSVVLSKQMKGRGKWIELDHHLYSPIAQSMVVVDNENKMLSGKFFAFLFSPEAKEILRKNGYELPN